nr:antibiotic biosynthesis monooxygenase [uncultured Gellertiella sp.]
MSEKSAAIARIWRGRTLPENADSYCAYLHEHGVKKLESLGALGVQMLREDREGDSYFMVVSFWESRDAMTRWAGEDPNRIRHLDRDREFLIELPASVQILDVVSNSFRPT